MFARTCVYEKIIVSLHAFYGLRIMEEVIRHEGVVKSVCGQMAHISISQASACQACKAQSMCVSSDSKEKEMDAVMLEPMQPGDRVEVQVEAHLAWKAVLLAYILPFAIMMVVMLVLLKGARLNESVVGSVSLASIALYYIVLGVFNNRLRRHFTFTARKL